MIGLPADQFTALVTPQGTLVVHHQGQVLCHLPDALGTPQGMAAAMAYALKHH